MTTILIPARVGGERLPQKPVIMIGDKPLIERVYDCSAKSGFKTMVCCPYDDSDIWKYMSHQGAEVIVSEREKTIRNGTERCAASVILSKPFKNGTMDDLIINVQGDNGWFNPAILQRLDSWFRSLLFVEQSPFVMGTMHYPILPDEIADPHVVKVFVDKESSKVMDFCRILPDKETPCFAHAGIYIYTVRTLVWYMGNMPRKAENEEKLEQLRFLFPTEIVPVPVYSLEIDRDDAPIAVNTPFDLQPLIDKYAQEENWTAEQIEAHHINVIKKAAGKDVPAYPL